MKQGTVKAVCYGGCMAVRTFSGGDPEERARQTRCDLCGQPYRPIVHPDCAPAIERVPLSLREWLVSQRLIEQALSA